MSQMQFEDTNKRKAGKRKTLFFSLAVCLLALSAGTWSALDSMRREQTVRPDQQTEAPVSEVPVQNVVESVTAGPAVPVETEAPTSAPQPETTEKQPSDTAGFFVMPIGGQIIKGFDLKQLQYSETYDDWRIHLGVDIAAEEGTEVKAAGDGRVTKVYTDTVLGNTVVIDHGNGIIAYYSGLNNPLVEEDAVVEVGTVLGGVDSVPGELVDPPHLHFAVQKNDVYIDPESLFEQE